MRRGTWTVIVAVLAAFTLVATACGDDSESTSTDGGDSDSAVTIEDPWSRATAPSAATGAVYMTITAETDDALIGASVDPSIAGEVQIHEVVGTGDMEDMDEEDMDEGDMDHEGDDESSDGGSVALVALQDDDSDEMDDSDMDEGDMDHEDSDGMTMQEVDEIPLPAGEPVVLEPGGYHIMLLDLATQLEAGDTFDVTLQFESGGTQTVTAEVREV